MELSKRIVEVLSAGTAAGPDSVNEDQAVSELAIDSLTFMDRIMQIEQQENIVLRDEEVDDILNAFMVRDIIAVFKSARLRSDSSK